MPVRNKRFSAPTSSPSTARLLGLPGCGNLACLIAPFIGDTLLVCDSSYKERSSANPSWNVSPVQKRHFNPFGIYIVRTYFLCPG
jgi:hypothetical protein